MITPAPRPLPGSTPVLVVGGGPAGLATAMELSHQGVPCLVVEPRQSVSWSRPRAKTVSPRTMELFRRWGVAATLRDRAPLPAQWSSDAVFSTVLLGREVTRITGCFGLDLRGDDLVAEPGQQAPQPLVEQVLRAALAASATATLATGWRVLELAGDGGDSGVTAVLGDEDGNRSRVHARYVVGADGARSIVRAAAGINYEGASDTRPNYNVVFRAPTLAALVPHGPAVHYWVLHPDQPALIGRLDLADTWWCVLQGVDRATGERDAPALLARAIGADVPVEILSADPWEARMLLADRYRARDLFLAGDAAHQNPPWGGHGFNTGVGDAVNLGWKLAGVLRGWADPALLESYEAERRPVAERTIIEAAGNMARLGRELTDPRLFSDAGFAAARPAVAATIRRAKDSEFHSLPLVLGYSYRDSPIVCAEPSGPASSESAYRPNAAPGSRLPHRWLGSGESLYDRLGRGYALLGNPDSITAQQFLAAAASLGVPLRTVGVVGRQRFGADFVLVRPDQHVAWRGDQCASARAVLHRATGRVSDHIRTQLPGGIHAHR